MQALVVGAGIAGLSTARALRQRGIAADVVERESAWRHEGTGIYLPGNAIRALDALGLKSAVVERAALIPRQRFCDYRGRVLTDIDLAPMWRDVGPCLALRRTDLHDVLTSHDVPVPVRMGVSPQQVSQHDQAATVTFADGSVGRYDLVIGADGIHSTARRLTFGSGSVRSVGHVAWRFVTTCPPEVTTWTVWLGPVATFLAVPVGCGQVYCYCDAPASEGNGQLEADGIGLLDELLAEFADPVSTILGTLGSADTIHVARIEEIVLDRWSRGRILLVGDAAHATAPNMAEGAAMAIEDGLVLADCLTAGEDLEAALANFQKRRQARTRWVTAQTHRRDRTRRLPPALRNLVLRMAGRQLFHDNYRPLRDAP